jgi:lipopolysaccharide biosynthesis regulator YciM
MAEKKEEVWDEDTIPFQDGPEDKAHHKYRCQSCGFSEWIPAWIIDEFAWMKSLE